MEKAQAITDLALTGAMLTFIVLSIIALSILIYKNLKDKKTTDIMETKNEQNISDIFDSFVEARERDNNIKSSLILIETKDERLIHVKGEEISIAESVFELCKEVPSIKNVMEVVLKALEKEKQAKATDESKHYLSFFSSPPAYRRKYRKNRLCRTTNVRE